ncbi:hypothetical protein [Natronolimnobius baerhuensis]|uniref:Uncharacterized protein n=1 Tax=Natronolimnobius baerhuensis TaxID=253108 RepID=A0A202E5X0_9EURY|nr:hypothetical protein [Natronolimnobius baerhuensis]OVE83310.1 hypothetical protein B2G88_12630 [Natronolimnobius baerhuensis]
MTDETADPGTVSLEMDADEFQTAVQDAVENALLRIAALCLGFVFTAVFVIAGSQSTVESSGTADVVFGIASIAFGCGVFWWAYNL